MCRAGCETNHHFTHVAVCFAHRPYNTTCDGDWQVLYLLRKQRPHNPTVAQSTQDAVRRCRPQQDGSPDLELAHGVRDQSLQLRVELDNHRESTDHLRRGATLPVQAELDVPLLGRSNVTKGLPRAFLACAPDVSTGQTSRTTHTNSIRCAVFRDRYC